MLKRFKILLTGLFLSFVLVQSIGCAITAPYDQHVYSQTTGLKVDALKLMDKATRAYDSQSEAISNFTDKWDKLYEYELHRARNDIRISMWNLLRDPDKNLMGGFLKRWKTESTLSETFINEAKIQVGRAFDQLAELESGKITPKELKQ